MRSPSWLAMISSAQSCRCGDIGNRSATPAATSEGEGSTGGSVKSIQPRTTR
ncbi:hypothetical protein [Nonomuraea recticatena]|uniref:hypothetical protein n=1 Tax=Nonomuraea recticatena TaxID=46178 RepID=UPI0036214575